VLELAALARAELPSMTALHDDEGWVNYNRFGAGREIFGNCTLTLRAGPGEQLIGFIWADAAMFTDHGILEEWWCINALAIAPTFRNKGRGAALVSEVVSAASLVGGGLLYGQSVPRAASFWVNMGFILADEGEAINTTSPARRTGQNPTNYVFAPGPGDRFFLKWLPADPESSQSRLLPRSQMPMT
jgi:GNAT superfamily N-acetyltransferase